jgi:hypothetical protein
MDQYDKGGEKAEATSEKTRFNSSLETNATSKNFGVVLLISF